MIQYDPQQTTQRFTLPESRELCAELGLAVELLRYQLRALL
jgi:hypothetical protein